MRDAINIMITGSQIRGARGMLRWSAQRLAEEAGLSLPTIQRMETVEGVPKSLATNLQAVRAAFERAGLIFIDRDGGGPGVRLRE